MFIPFKGFRSSNIQIISHLFLYLSVYLSIYLSIYLIFSFFASLFLSLSPVSLSFYASPVLSTPFLIIRSFGVLFYGSFHFTSETLTAVLLFPLYLFLFKFLIPHSSVLPMSVSLFPFISSYLLFCYCIYTAYKCYSLSLSLSVSLFLSLSLFL